MFKWLCVIIAASSLLPCPVNRVDGSPFEFEDYDNDYTGNAREYDRDIPFSETSQMLKYFSGIPRSTLAQELPVEEVGEVEAESEEAKEETASNDKQADIEECEDDPDDAECKEEAPSKENSHSKTESHPHPHKAESPSKHEHETHSPSPKHETTSKGDLKMQGPSVEHNENSRLLHQLIQHVYIAQARVQLEAIEIKKAQTVADASQAVLEAAAAHVRSMTAALQSAQQEVASAAIRAQTAQLQLAAHDQLLFAARQDVDALSSQVVGLEAAEGIQLPKITFDTHGLIERLGKPLPSADRPTAIPPVVQPPHTFRKSDHGSCVPVHYFTNDYEDI